MQMLYFRPFGLILFRFDVIREVYLCKIDVLRRALPLLRFIHGRFFTYCCFNVWSSYMDCSMYWSLSVGMADGSVLTSKVNKIPSTITIIIVVVVAIHKKDTRAFFRFIIITTMSHLTHNQKLSFRACTGACSSGAMSCIVTQNTLTGSTILALSWRDRSFSGGEHRNHAWSKLFWTIRYSKLHQQSWW